MSELKRFLVDEIKDANTYSELVWRSGLSAFAPAIVTCAITGGNNGKESNPNLPETVQEQVESAYEAYKAGANMIHIHTRCKDNTSVMSFDPELYEEVNIKIREKCPDVIINNTCICGRGIDPAKMTVSPSMTSIIAAGAEVGSVDVSNYFSSIPMAAREGVNDGKPWMLERGYCISQAGALEATKMMQNVGMKPEFECFQLSDLQYVNWLVKNGYVDANGAPNWIHFVFTVGGSNWPAPEFFNTLKQVTPRNSMLGIIAAGAQQWAVLAQALVHGLQVRVGMEDSVYLEKGRKADSNAQLVEKIIQIAKLLGRPVATCEEARTMLGLGAPKTWKTGDFKKNLQK
jgi:3-keto-5-aminohexanoate cleavage enzyme